MPMLEVKQLQIIRGERLLEYDLTLENAQCLLMTGPSGVGKTSLLEAIAGFVPIQSGRVVLNGEEITNKPPHLRPINSQFQSGNLFDHLTVYQNIALALKQERVSKGDIGAMLAALGLSDVLALKSSKLSGGMRQRVSLARNLLRQRPLTLLDEPFSALDEENRQKAIALIEGIASTQQRGFIVAAHQLSGEVAWPEYAIE